MKSLIIVHPGVQHAYRLANASASSGLFSNVYLLTGLILNSSSWWVKGPIKKRIKVVNTKVTIKNFPLYEFCSQIIFRFYSLLFKPQTDAVIRCMCQFVFEMRCLPVIFLKRKNSILVCYETSGWPLNYIARKINLPVIMDFASISHEAAESLGIQLSKFENYLKEYERKQIDYAFFCSHFAADTYQNKTSAKKSFVIHPGADIRSHDSSISHKTVSASNVLKISCVGNTFYRKGMDIILDTLCTYRYQLPIEIHFIGKITSEVDKWKSLLKESIKMILIPTLEQREMFKYLESKNFDLNIQPSRFDSFCMTVPETMILGIPNILSPYVGVGELLTHRVNVLKMEKLDPESLNNELCYWLSLSNSQRQLFKENVIMKAKEISWEEYNKKVALTFGEILSTL